MTKNRKNLLPLAFLALCASAGILGENQLPANAPGVVLPPPAVPAERNPQADEEYVHPAGSEIAVVLYQDRFFPSRLVLRAGAPTTLVFATVNRKPAALVIEPISVQRWIASGGRSDAGASLEINREVNIERVTVVSFEPVRGRYRFHDALGGARGEIVVE